MPEEMEIMSDLGPEGFAEDIDIDLDLAAAAHPDEDLELADFDHSADLQIFHSDGRDELMAEDDDASYGMVDADDIEQSAVMAPSDDIEIDLGATEDDTDWQQNTANTVSANTVNEIDFVDVDADEDRAHEAETENTWIGSNAVTSEYGPQDSTNSQASHMHIEETSGNAQTTIAEPASNTTEAAVAEASAVIDTPAVPPETTNDEPSMLHTLDSSIVHESGQQGGEVEEHGTAELDGYEKEKEVFENEEITQQDEQTDELTEKMAVPPQATNRDGHDLGQDADGGTDSTAPEDPGHISEAPPDITSQSRSPHAEASVPGNSHLSTEPEDSRREEEQTNENPGVEHAADPIDKVHIADNGEEDPGHLDSDAHGQTSNEAVQDQPTDETLSQPVSDAQGSLDAVLARHELIIHYMRTDYHLLAEPDNYDPDTYFLKDPSVLVAPLDQFLAALRDVISAEISPLDELVLHIDGLGLEFAESSCAGLLEGHTFNELLVLYDQLTLNDGADSLPPFYCCLLVRPSGAQRLLALQESAKAGHGLSQVAVYRESTPNEEMEDEDTHSDFDSGSDLHEDEEDVHHGETQVDSASHQRPQPADGEDHSEPFSEVQQTDQEEPSVVAENRDDGEGAAANEEYIDELDLSTSYQDESATNVAHDDNEAQPEDDLPDEEGTEQDVSRDAALHDNEALLSANSSATVTANGDDNDEIGYSEDEADEEGATAEEPQQQETQKQEPKQQEPAGLQQNSDFLDVRAQDDEITWESETEIDVKPSAVQVSPVAGKRTRSDSISVTEGSEQNDVKRQRS